MHSTDQKERGVAMMVVLFALLLLSVVGLGMMYSTNMETSINGNYRDKQVAFYAALAGLQEGRERIRNTSTSGPSYNITPPSLLPSTSGANVIYILAKAASVSPWTSGTSYFDTELCQEHVLSLTGTVGVPCTTTASGTSWYQVFDDSLSSAAPWNLTHPLDWKWTRITLKSNNMTQYPVNGNSGDGSQVCWNGTSEISSPTGYTTGCKPVGGVTAILVSNSGSGYTATGPTITICGTDTAGTNGCPSNSGPGSGATATAVMQQQMTGYVSAISLTTGGAGYVSAPTVAITGDGTGATATAILSSSGTTTTTAGSVTTVTLTTGGANYTTAPAVTLSGGGGSGATATATLSSSGTHITSGYVSTVNVTNGGKGYTSAPTVNFSNSGGGSGATATATLGTSGEVVSVAINTQPTNGTAQCFSQPSDVVVTFSGSSGSGATAVGVLENTRSCIYSVTPMPVSNCSNKLDLAGGYNPPDQKAGVTFTTGNQSFSGTLYVSVASQDKKPTSLTVQKPGYDTTNYTNGTFTSTLELYGPPAAAWPDCNNLIFTANTGYRLASINVTNGGSGYTASTTATISGGIGSNEPTATATIGYPISSVTVTNGGDHYNSAPTVSFSGGGAGCSLCTDATATASVVVTNTYVYPVAYVTVTSGGAGYTSAPTVSFSGGGGSGAAATAAVSATNVTTYPVASINLTAGGTGYSTAAVSISGGGGSGAAATASTSTMATGTYYVSAINPNGNPSGSGYTSDPTVMITGGGGSGATATSQISGGTKFGQVWMITSLAQTSTGARSMLQMEVGSPVLGFSPGGALTLDGPSPHINGMPNSDNFVVRGSDANSCHETADPDHPAIDGYDDPNNPTNPSAVTTIINALPRPDHYTGVGPTPSVQNGYAALGPTMTTPGGLNQLIGNITTAATTLSNGHLYTGLPANMTDANIALGSCPTGNIHDASCKTVVDVVQGNLTLNGNATGYGVLVVEGTLNMGGDFSWHGPVFVIGDGVANFNGGGTGQIQGQMYISKIWNGDNVHYPSTNLLGTHDVGPPTITWVGGGNNGILFDHCWSQDLMNAIPGVYYSNDAYKVLSFRILPY